MALERQLDRARARCDQAVDGSRFGDFFRNSFQQIEKSQVLRERSLRDEIEELHVMARITEVLATGALENIDLAKELNNGESTWADRKDDVVLDDAQAKAIARQMFISSRAQAGERIVIAASGMGRQIVEGIVEICLRAGVDFDIDFQDALRAAILAKHLSDEIPVGTPDGTIPRSPLQILAETRLALYESVGKTIQVVSTTDPRVKELGNTEKSAAFDKKLAPRKDRLRSGSLHYIVTFVPTRQDAELDGMPYEDYMKMFLEACDQPWEEIRAAQVLLKEKFDRANTVHITNDDGTDVTFDITGQTFANSVVLKNLPGSEIFSSALKEGVNGRIVAKGRFQYGNYPPIEDITLEFKGGKIIRHEARVGQDTLGQIISMDDGKGEGTRFLGELGIGTNPHLRTHNRNPLLVEKIGGSFHVAVGSCYSYTEYDGEPVNLQNGNRSASGIHWDVTTLLRGKHGKMELTYPDEKTELVQDNGEWLVKGCDVLNQGWNALPEVKRPDWWKNEYPNGY